MPDSVLNSAIGCYDGNVYQRLYEEAKTREPLNRTDVSVPNWCECAQLV